MQPYRIARILETKPLEKTITVQGWLKTRRDSKELSFLELNDGSCLANLQVLAPESLANYQQEVKKLTTGCALAVTGRLLPSPAKGQEVELHADSLLVHGWSPAESYPLQKKQHSFEFLRDFTHLRPRTNSLGAMARVRSTLSFAVHRFFQERGFCQLHTPVIGTSDCEGAGEMFTVTAFDLENVPRLAGKVDWEKDFFGRQASLTVSGQLEAEAYALALGQVYTFGPTFRAENSHTSRHLAEFWMIEPEVAFCDLQGDIALAEEFLKYLVQAALDHCAPDLELFAKFVEPGLRQKLATVLEHDFIRLSYSEAVEHLLRAKKSFAFPVSWGHDLQAEHERYLTDELFKRPLVVTDYPKTIKPFYMRANDDGRTVAAMDLLVPGIGELVGGSQREERYDVLHSRMVELGLDTAAYQWYLDLRRYGSAPHAGFGLGFERLILFLTGLGNVRDVIPFPRTPGAAR